MTAAIQRWISAGVLAIWGTVLIYFYLSERVKHYLNPAFIPWMIICGFVLVLMAIGLIVLAWLEKREAAEKEAGAQAELSFGPVTSKPALVTAGGCGEGGVHDHSACGHDHGDDCCGHDHGGTKLRIFPALVLVVPILTASIVSPDQFGATAVENRGFAQSVKDLPMKQQPYTEPALPTEDGSVDASATPTETKPSSDYLPRNAAGQIKAQTVDLMYAAEEPVMREDFENKQVEMIGQYMPAKRKNADGNRFNLVRMFVNCCASDAQPVAVSVQVKEPSKAVEMSWVKVIGTATFPMEGGRRTPVVVAESVTPCDPPEESFIY